ncbi:MAG: CaiB/BaiF CoA transferase family protein [Dehalococcoidia bacterium]
MTEQHNEATPDLRTVRIADFSRMIAGSHVTSLLAMFGAEVIKIESSLHPDSFRVTLQTGDDLNSSRQFECFNRNKKSVSIDMSSERGREIAARLIKISDVVMENFSPGVMERWGLDYPHLKKIKPDIIMCILPGMGRKGPQSHYVTWGANLLAYSGFTHLWDHPDSSEPVGVQIAFPDYIASVEAAIAIMAALDYRARTGRGQFIEIAQIEGTMSMLPTSFLEYFVTGHEPAPRGNRSRHASPCGCYPCRGEDRWCVITVSTDTEWMRFRQAIGDPPWARKERFATVPGRIRHADELDGLVAEWTCQHTPHEAMKILQESGIAAGAVQNAQDLFHDPHLRSRQMLWRTNHPKMAGLTFPGVPIKLSGSPGKIISHSPLLGQDNYSVFGELLGMSPEEIEDLCQQGVLI